MKPPVLQKGVGAKPWIKMRTDLWDDPRVAALCDALSVTEATVIGGLYRLWSIADSHSEDGELCGLTGDSLDRKAGISGFAATLERVGWLIVSDGKITIPRFTEHNGGSAKSRANGALRQRSHRARTASKTDTKPVTSASRMQRDKIVTREDEIREDEIREDEIRPPPPSAADAANSRSEEVEVEFANADISEAVPLVKDALQRGYQPDELRSILAHQQQRRDVLGSGAVVFRIRNSPPGTSIDKGWPDSKKVTPANTADDAHLESRYAQRLNAMKPSDLLAAMERAGIDADKVAHVRHVGNKIRGQLLRHLDSEVRTSTTAPNAKPPPAASSDRETRAADPRQ